MGKGWTAEEESVLSKAAKAYRSGHRWKKIKDMYFPTHSTKQVRDKAQRMGLKTQYPTDPAGDKLGQAGGGAIATSSNGPVDLSEEGAEEEKEDIEELEQKKFDLVTEDIERKLGKGPGPTTLTTKNGMWVLFNKLRKGRIQFHTLPKHRHIKVVSILWMCMCACCNKSLFHQVTVKPDPPSTDDLLDFTYTNAEVKAGRKKGAPAHRKLYARLTKAIKKQRPSITPYTYTYQVPDGYLFRGLRTAEDDDYQGIYLTKDNAEEEDLFADDEEEDGDGDDD